MRTWIAVALLTTASTGCLRETAFHCATDTDCAGAGAGAACEDVGFCSVDDGSCGGGRRFTELAGNYAGTCVGDVVVVDAAVSIDALPDATPHGAAPPVGQRARRPDTTARSPADAPRHPRSHAIDRDFRLVVRT